MKYGLPKQVVLDRLVSLTNPSVIFLTNKGEGGNVEGEFVANGHVAIHSNGEGYAVNSKVFSVDERQQN